MEGTATPAQIGGLLVALRMKGETVEEITGAVRAMRAPRDPGRSRALAVIVDTCGTGGDRRGTFNISTAAAFIAAGAGLTVAKHGNRAMSGTVGGADVLEALGVKIDLPPERVAACIDEVGIGFLFAQVFHPAMRHVAGPRRELGVRTIFNLLGPLSNPAGARHQVVGVFAPEWTEPLAHALGRLGAVHALVVHGDDGLDEISLAAPTQLSEWNDGTRAHVPHHARGVRLPALSGCGSGRRRARGSGQHHSRHLGGRDRSACRHRGAQRRGGDSTLVVWRRRSPRVSIVRASPFAAVARVRSSNN